MSFAVLPFIAFAIATSVTPGPNNVLVAASAARFGVRRTVPHMFGIAAGFALMVLLAGMGLAAPLAHYPAAQGAMRLVGALWLLVIAWKIATAGARASAATTAPLGFFGAAAFQWVNPKAWMMVLGMAGAWITGREAVLPQIAVMALVFALVCVPCCLVWAAVGVGAAPLLSTDRRLRSFNVAMAVLLVASLVPVLLD